MKRCENKFQACSRRERGSITILLLFGTFGFVILTMLLLELESAFVAHDRLASLADSLSLEEALILNGVNNTGQMNEAIVNSRECVFEDRRVLQTISSQRPDLIALASQTLNNSRQGAMILEANRQTLLSNIVDSSKGVLQKETRALEANGVFTPLFQATPKPHLEISLGSLKGSETNVFARAQSQELYNFDTQQNFIDQASNHYRGNCNLPLPSPDNDLVFRVSALPDRVMHEPTKQVRLVSSDKFESMLKVDLNAPQSLSQLPSASQVAVWFDLEGKKSPLPVLCLRCQSAAVCMGDLADYEAPSQDINEITMHGVSQGIAVTSFEDLSRKPRASSVAPTTATVCATQE